MNHTRQFLVGFRNTWTVATGLVAVLVGFFALQRPDRAVARVVASGGPEWVVVAYAVAVPAFAASFVVFMLSAYATVEDSAENVYDRLLVCPVAFPRLLLVRTLPVAACGAAAALVLGVAASVTLPALTPTTALAAVAAVAVATVPVAVLITLLYLLLDDPRVGTVAVFAVIFAAVALPRYGLAGLAGGVTVTPTTLALAGGAVIAGLYALAALAVTRVDPERIVLG